MKLRPRCFFKKHEVPFTLTLIILVRGSVIFELCSWERLYECGMLGIRMERSPNKPTISE